MTTSTQARQCFLEQYRHVRHAEGRGSEDPSYYCSLPYKDLTGRNSAMWAMRARTYRYFEQKLLSRWERKAKRALDVLDLGAGNCWMSYRLGLRGHRVHALDIFSDRLDGLLAAQSYPFRIPTVEAEFDLLPFEDKSFDLAIFNASFHYSTDYAVTLREIRRCLRPSGSVAVLDSPIYRTAQYGRQMVEERKKGYRRRFGFASDAMGSIEFLDEQTLKVLSRELGMEWKICRPWYGWRWHLRPLSAFVQRRRPPSRFWILSGSFSDR